jgi:hypothetical protein
MEKSNNNTLLYLLMSKYNSVMQRHDTKEADNIASGGRQKDCVSLLYHGSLLNVMYGRNTFL